MSRVRLQTSRKSPTVSAAVLVDGRPYWFDTVPAEVRETLDAFDLAALDEVAEAHSEAASSYREAQVTWRG